MNPYSELPNPEERAREEQHQKASVQYPLPAAAEHTQAHSRRRFLFKLAVGLNAMVGAVLAVPLLGYVFGPIFRRDSSYDHWIPLGAVDAMPVGATRLAEYTNPDTSPTDGVTVKIPCWARRTSPNEYVVFAINCAHLGCPVRWFEQSQLFLCPCHGGSYYADGSVAAGPPPRGLYKYKTRIANGKVYIDAGELPTLRDRACGNAPSRDLIQITPDATSEAHNLLPPRSGAFSNAASSGTTPAGSNA